MDSPFPYFATATVVKGFGRGGKQLGMPTANMDRSAVSVLPEALHTGVYYGFGCVDNGSVHEMVMSIGTNPFYNNKERSMEVHLLHEFENDFYDSKLRIIIVGFVRDMSDFPSLDALKAAIANDVVVAKERLADPTATTFRHHEYFQQ
ncbi:putative riboflavin kinase [Sycon ciliatum]|uniref:putative riboflavin kinase n=1 Tax=Sycon ciliatum TaxID=27933 RepID=UPI0020AB9559|eukprot:scpid84825/ scgid26119/ Putative riboflavin kinase; ATP:riboflavin 5&apos; Flavokinase